VIRFYDIIAAASILAATGVRAADAVSEYNAFPRQPTEYELRWDNGTLGYVRAYILGGTWVANDFDATTLSATHVRYLRFFSTPEWPNRSWDGCKIGIYRLVSGQPGALIWGPEFVKGSGPGYRWCTFDVDWSLPKGILKFVAAVEQPYDYPYLDPYCLDTSPATGRAWTYYQGIWKPLETYTNLMLRVVMQGDIGVAPTSVGRVKALYY
jgi:hypothetical protein